MNASEYDLYRRTDDLAEKLRVVTEALVAADERLSRRIGYIEDRVLVRPDFHPDFLERVIAEDAELKLWEGTLMDGLEDEPSASQPAPPKLGLLRILKVWWDNFFYAQGRR